MNLKDYFNKGLTIEQYIKSQKKHTEAFTHILNTFTLDDDVLYDQLKEKNVRVIAIVEEWCGHCMLNAPLLIKLSEKADLPVRFLPRDEHPELMDQYLTNNKRIIPIFIFIDEDGQEIAKWGPVAPKITELVNDYRKDLPEKDEAGYDEAFKDFIKRISSAFETDETIWQTSFADIKATISQDVL